jgi:hypothetical protein
MTLGPVPLNFLRRYEVCQLACLPLSDISSKAWNSHQVDSSNYRKYWTKVEVARSINYNRKKV